MKNQLQQTFIELIHIDEIYDQEDKVITYVKNFLENLGLKVVIDAFRNVVAYIPGKGEPLLLNSHLDTPENVANLAYTIEGNTIRSNGTSILGADPKSGVAVLLELARYIKEKQIQTQPIEFVFTRGEEAGLYGAKNLDYSLISSRYGLVLDEDGPCTNIVTRAPSFYCLDVTITGKTVHPRDWSEGVNALGAGVHALSAIKQGEIVKGVTCNIGKFSSGTARNSVPGEVTVEAEMRSFHTNLMLTQAIKVEKVFRSLEESHQVIVKIHSELEIEGYRLQKTHPLFSRLEKTYRQMQLSPHYYETFGGSDANVFNAHGITTVPIGSGYYLAHQYQEYVNLAEMEELLLFLTEFVQK